MTPSPGDFDSVPFFEAALEGAHLAVCSLELSSGALQWAGDYRTLFALDNANRFSTLPLFVAQIDYADREAFESVLRAAAAQGSDFHFDFRMQLAEPAPRWFAVKGRFSAQTKAGRSDRGILVFEDVTDRKRLEFQLLEANSELKAHNERLQIGIAESHHRVKNSLQNVISLLNLQVRKAGSLNGDQVKKLSSLIHGLAVLHDILNEQAREHGDVKSISVDRVFERVVSIATRGASGRKIESRFEPCRVTPRQAASLNVIFNELVSNALKHGNAAVSLTLQSEGDRATLEVSNEGSQFAAGFSAESCGQAGLALLKVLCTSDLNCEPVFRNEPPNVASVSITFSTLPKESSNLAAPAPPAAP